MDGLRTAAPTAARLVYRVRFCFCGIVQKTGGAGCSPWRQTTHLRYRNITKLFGFTELAPKLEKQF
jgi:hypothetical protein